MKKNMRTAFLISGRGSTVEYVIREYQMGKLDGIEPVLIVSSNAESPFLKRAADEKNNLPVQIEKIDRKDFPSGKAGREPFGNALLRLFSKYDIQLVSQNGWMEFTPKNVLREFEWRIINQHPGKTPEFAGLKAEQAVAATLAYYWMTLENPYSTSTIHHTIEEMDMGNIILARRVSLPLRSEITSFDNLRRQPGDLINATRSAYKALLPEEYINVINTLRVFAYGDEAEVRGDTPVQEFGLGKNEGILYDAKELAKELF